MITEAIIRDRLAQANAGAVVLPTWDEVQYLLHLIHDLRDGLREAGADLALMEENLARCEQERERTNWL